MVLARLKRVEVPAVWVQRLLQNLVEHLRALFKHFALRRHAGLVPRCVAEAAHLVLFREELQVAVEAMPAHFACHSQETAKLELVVGLSLVVALGALDPDAAAWSLHVKRTVEHMLAHLPRAAQLKAMPSVCLA